MTALEKDVTYTPSESKESVDRLSWALAVANLVAQIGIIVTGGLVRVTGSGLGCSTWPMCEPGQFTPVFHEETSYHAFVEFGNRTLTGVLGVVALAMLLAFYFRPAMKRRPKTFVILAWTVLGGIAAQALIGGVSVLWELHPAIVGSHMYVSLGLVALSAYIVARFRQEDGPAVAPSSVLRMLVRALVAVAAAMLVAGVVTTGTGPHSGDAEAPYRFALDPLMVTRIHSLLAWSFVALLVLVVWRSVSEGFGATVWIPLIAITVLQGVVGYIQYFNGLPILLVVTHMLLAALLVSTLVHGATQLWRRKAPQPA